MCDDFTWSEWFLQWITLTGYIVWVSAAAGYAAHGAYNTPVSCELIPVWGRVALGAIAVILALWGPWYLHTGPHTVPIRDVVHNN